MVDKLFMLTAQKGEDVFADVFSDFTSLKTAYAKFKATIDVRTWLLTPVSSTEKEDMVIVRIGSRYIACIGQKAEVHSDSDHEFIRVKSQEIRVKE